MTLFHAVLLLATFLCSLVSGFLLAFAIVVMPGLASLDDSGFIRAFQVIDRIIQNRQPLFIFVWAGSVLAVVLSAMLGIRELGGASRLLIIVAALVYLLGVQLPTVTINIPLNNELQRVDSHTISEPMRQRARSDFERRWNRWNVFRTVCSSFTSVLLLLVLLRA